MKIGGTEIHVGEWYRLEHSDEDHFTWGLVLKTTPSNDMSCIFINEDGDMMKLDINKAFFKEAKLDKPSVRYRDDETARRMMISIFTS